LAGEILNIIGVTLTMALFSTSIGAGLGTLAGLALERNVFPLKPLVVRVCRTLMGTPPVVAGLVVYILFRRRGVFGALEILYSIPAMVIAQTLIITPIVCGLVHTSASRLAPRIRSFAKTMGANSHQSRLLVIKEMRSEIYFAVLTAFSRSISEVGAVMIVGGNLKNKTRTMTTAISMLNNMGEIPQAVILGAVLLILAFVIQSLSDRLRLNEGMSENY
jgi:tungstate transport system permease protein